MSSHSPYSPFSSIPNSLDSCKITQTYITVTSSALYDIAKLEESKAPTGKISAALNDRTQAIMMDSYNVSKLIGVFVVKKMAAMAALSSGNVILNCVASG